MGNDRTIDSSEVPQLIVQLPDGKEVHHSILGHEVSIGRDPSNRISISDHFVSKFHAKLLVSSQGFTLVDLGSSNKTLVNGREVSTKVTVRYGDEIRFANVKCHLKPPKIEKRKSGAPAPSSAAPSPPARAAVPTPRAAAVAPEVAPAPPPPARKATSKPDPPKAPPVPTNPMTRLYIVGGVLIGISLVLALLLRLLLVPSEEAGRNQAEGSSIPPAATANAPAAGEPASPETPLAEPPSPEAPVPFNSPTAPSPVAPQQSVEFYFNEALSYLDIGRLKEARANFRKVLELDPQNTRARTRLSLLEEEIENKAERHFNNAREAFNFLRYHEAVAEWEIFLTLVEPSDSRHTEAQEGIEQARAKLR